MREVSTREVEVPGSFGGVVGVRGWFSQKQEWDGFDFGCGEETKTREWLTCQTDGALRTDASQAPTKIFPQATGSHIPL